MREQPSNMQRDILTLNMEEQVEEIAAKKFGKTIRTCTNEELYYVLLDYCKRLLAVTEQNTGEKRVYYISAEFLIGKLLSNNLINLKIYDQMNALLKKNGKTLSEIEEVEPEPSLGNGGLGRLASCFLDSIATLDLPGEGIGLNYHYGLFRQVLDDHLQKAEKDPWMEEDSWETKTSTSFDVYFGDRKVTSRMYDIDVVGYDTGVNKLRLFDVDTVDDSLVQEGISFDKTDIEKNLTLFLYPDDSDENGKLLRIYQQYFMVSNAAQLILQEMKERKYDLRRLYDYAVIQINDTHPTLIIPELIRILTDEKAMSMDEAIEVVSKTCAYTNHTILAEALETWPMEYLEQVVPQLIPIIKELDRRVRDRYDDPKVQIIDEDNRVHMAYIDIHYGFSVNGVAAIHTEILKQSELHSFYEIYPEKFNNKTNGITFRRWLLSCNHPLADFLSETISDAYKTDANRLEDLLAYKEDDTVLNRLGEIKRGNKLVLTDIVRKKEGVELDPDGIFDIQIKRLHEYKRQQMNALYIIHKYLEIKGGKKPTRPLNFIFGAKAAPAYVLAQDIIHLLLVLQDIINHDPEVNPYMHLVFVTNYNVTYAEKLIPACEISEQISLASKEASGTSNMKFMLNGAVTLGTADGANVEIHDLVGDDNIYMFGIDSKEVIAHYKNQDYVSKEYYDKSPVIQEAVDFIVGPQCMAIGHEENLTRLHDDILNKDYFMALVDLEDYIRVKDQMIEDYENQRRWNQMSLVNIAKAGYFSSDRTIQEYNRDIWHLR